MIEAKSLAQLRCDFDVYPSELTAIVSKQCFSLDVTKSGKCDAAVESCGQGDCRHPSCRDRIGGLDADSLKWINQVPNRFLTFAKAGSGLAALLRL
jgi:hypothetical protein